MKLVITVCVLVCSLWFLSIFHTATISELRFLGFSESKQTWQNGRVKISNVKPSFIKNCTIPLIAVVMFSKKVNNESLSELAKRVRGKLLSVPIVVLGEENARFTIEELPIDTFYFGPVEQLTLAAKIGVPVKRFMAYLPYKHIGRKSFGYLVAISKGACSVWDADEKNFLTIGDLPSAAASATKTFLGDTMHSSLAGVRPRHLHNISVTNPYLVFAPTKFIWPRGYPIQFIRKSRLGHSHDTPELVRFSPTAASRVAVLQSVANVNPDVDTLFSLTEPIGDVHFLGSIPALLIQPGTYAPYNSQASLHSRIGFWAMYLPISVNERVSDVLRSYISQTVFSLCGFGIGFTRPWVTSEFKAIKEGQLKEDGELNTLNILMHLTSWRRSTEQRCESSLLSMCNSADMLQDVYILLHELGVLGFSDVEGLQAWLVALNELGYVFPHYEHSSTRNKHFVISPQRPTPVFPAHAAVHINNGFVGTIPVWHFLFAAQYGEGVTYFVEADPAGDPVEPFLSVFPTLTVESAFPPRVPHVPGFLAYETLLRIWGAGKGQSFVADQLTLRGPRVRESFGVSAGVGATAIVWQHEDAVVSPTSIATWVFDETKCAAAVIDNVRRQKLPNISSWSSHSWAWARESIVIASAKAATESGSVHCVLDGKRQPINSSSFWLGSSDFIALRRSCPESRDMISTLQSLYQTALFLEIALPTSHECSMGRSKVTQLPLQTWYPFKERANATWMNRFFLRQVNATNDPRGFFHPFKYARESETIVTAMVIRDSAWKVGWSKS